MYDKEYNGTAVAYRLAVEQCLTHNMNSIVRAFNRKKKIKNVYKIKNPPLFLEGLL